MKLLGPGRTAEGEAADDTAETAEPEAVAVADAPEDSALARRRVNRGKAA